MPIRETLGTLLRRAVAAKARAGPPVPRGARALTGPHRLPWHVRTAILPLPGGDPVELLLVNLIAGRVGVAGFDDDPPVQPDGDDVHLVVLALGPGLTRQATFTFPRPPPPPGSRETLVVEDKGLLYRVAGAWPVLRTELRVADWDLELCLDTRCEPPVEWWSDTRPLYSHYSAFGLTRGSLKVGGGAQAVEARISLEHGGGGNLLRLPGSPALPASLFHYQLGALDGGELFAFGCFSALGVEVFRRGVLITADGRRLPISDWTRTDERLATVPDRCGGSIDVPVELDVHASGEGLALDYHAVAMVDPFAGRGRLTSGGARLEGRLSVDGATPRPVVGSVYLEHLVAAR